MSLRIINGKLEFERRAEIERIGSEIADAETLVVSFCKDNIRHFRIVGDVDWDAEAGFLSRMLMNGANAE